MYVRTLRLRNWRNIENADLAFQPGLNVFVGANAQGKTNILEAVFYLATVSSHRTNRNEDLIHWDQPAAHIRGEVIDRTTSHMLECGLERRRRILKRDSESVSRVGDLYGTLRAAFFTPEDLEIVCGSPEQRRRFLDMAVAQTRPGYVRLLQRYRKIVRQRNEVLRSSRGAVGPTLDSQLHVWNVSLSELGAEIVAARKDAIQKLAPAFQEHYHGLAEEGTTSLDYPTRCEGDTLEELSRSILQQLDRTRQRDLDRGTTTVGPHREDLSITLEERAIAVFGSQGQRRTAALALRLAESQMLAEESGEPPVLLIDDVLYEMDKERRRRFWDRMPEEYQLLVTATDHQELAATRHCGGMFHVERGSIYPA